MNICCILRTTNATDILLHYSYTRCKIYFRSICDWTPLSLTATLSYTYYTYPRWLILFKANDHLVTLFCVGVSKGYFNWVRLNVCMVARCFPISNDPIDDFSDLSRKLFVIRINAFHAPLCSLLTSGLLCNDIYFHSKEKERIDA